MKRDEWMKKNLVGASAVSGILFQRRTHCLWILSPHYIPPFTEITASGDGEGGYVCFACGKSTELDEPYVCVSRLWQVTPQGESRKAVLDAMASLQVCIPCTHQAARHKLTWIHKPKLTELEHEGFYYYSRLLNQALARRISDTRVKEPFVVEMNTNLSGLIRLVEFPDIVGGGFREVQIKMVDQNSCAYCNHAIDSNSPHMLIEIEVSIPKANCIDPQNILTLGEYCPECSKMLFKVNGRGFTNYEGLF